MDDRRLLLFFAFSLAILVGWQMLMPAAPAPLPAPLESAESQAPGELESIPQPAASEVAEPAEVESSQATGPPVEASERQATVVETAVYRAELDNRGAQLVSFVLKEHLDAEDAPLDLVRRREVGPWPLGLVGDDLQPHSLDEALFAVSKVEEGGTTQVEFSYRGPLGSARKSLRFDDKGLVEIELSVDGGQPWGVLLGPGIRNQDPDAKETRFANRKAVWSVEGEINTERVDKLDDLVSLPGRNVTWVGLEDTHFVSVFLPRSGVGEARLQPVLMKPLESSTGISPESSALRELIPFDHEEGLAKEMRALPRDARWILRSAGPEMVMDAYFGPKEFEILRELGHDLEKTVEWGGMLRHVVRPLLAGLNWLHANVVPNYGWAIVLMTIGLKIVLFPLTHKSFVSMQKMQKLQPQMKAIRQRYKGKMKDKRGKMDLEVQRKMNEEMQALFKSEGASPTGGCLPILLQMPIFFAFFRLLSTAVEIRHEPWILWVKDLSAPDPLFVLPVMMGVTQILQQKLTPAAGDPMQRKIMQLFPWMFMIFSLSFPSGLVLYWTVNNLFTIAQTTTYKKWRERKEAEEKLLAKTRKANKGERTKR
ncbi:MAG: membrane protein insertase YidC [Thermoanaerobaculia bacterium]|nr:membrane protein insertase YidC [Thermoanaerobaculia bacterium]